MSKLNLSSTGSHIPVEKVSKTEKTDKKNDNNLSVVDIDDDYRCEYKEEIWKNLLEQETGRMPIHLQSPQLEFRGALVQQLRDMSKKLGLTMATLHAAVTLLDQFMDAHKLRSDRLTHVALACLSLAADLLRAGGTLEERSARRPHGEGGNTLAYISRNTSGKSSKSEEKFSRAPTLKTLIKTSGVHICGKIFRQLEWMVGQHVRWRLLMPTAVTYAALIAQHVVADSDLITRHPKFVRRFKRDGVKLLNAYLDLTLSDARLKVVETVDVGCACVACARADLGLRAWPPWLAEVTNRDANKVAPIARLLQRMMQVMKSRETGVDNADVDQGYGSAKTTPNLTPTTSPQSHTNPTINYINIETTKQVNDENSDESNPALDLTTDTYDPRPQSAKYPTDAKNFAITDPSDFAKAQTADARSFSKVDANDPNEFRFCKSHRLLDTDVQPSKMAVKRTLGDTLDIEHKRLRLVI
ncbi:Cyclin-J [Eumeta japonica]|uniref:Cyclin-J n=1 Tax=Eumeta variegata TaxID=151549 RepID=A0A4C1ST21_EUMVA|nr:Cyclin-J [Eumeta japonica]